MISTALQGCLNHPQVERKEAVQLIRILSQPVPRPYIRDIKPAYTQFSRTQDVRGFVESL